MTRVTETNKLKKTMTPTWGNVFSSVHPSNSLVTVLDPCQGLFEITQRPSRAFVLPHSLLLELHRNKDTVRCAMLGSEVLGRHQKQLTQTLILHLSKTPFFALFQKLEGPGAPDDICFLPNMFL